MAPPGLSPGVAAGDARAASERTMTVRSRVPPSDVVVSRSLCVAQVHLRPLLSHRLSNEGGLNLPCLVE